MTISTVSKVVKTVVQSLPSVSSVKDTKIAKLSQDNVYGKGPMVETIDDDVRMITFPASHLAVDQTTGRQT